MTAKLCDVCGAILCTDNYLKFCATIRHIDGSKSFPSATVSRDICFDCADTMVAVHPIFRSSLEKLAARLKRVCRWPVLTHS